MNLYAYVGNDPLNWVDFMGTRKESPSSNPDWERKVAERPSRTSRQDGSKGGRVARALTKIAVALGIATAVGDELQKRDLVKVYRVYGGKAGLTGREDSTKGSYWTTEDPRQQSTREGVRDRYALPPEWGNGITQLAEGQIEAGNPNITSWGFASPETTASGTFRGGASEMTIRNSLANVKNLRISDLEYEEDH